MSDCLRCPVCSCAHFLCTLRMRPRVQRASGIPCALFTFEGVKFPANLGRNTPRECEHTSSRRHPRRRVTQYSRGASDRTEKPRRTGSPACAGDDGFVCSRRARFAPTRWLAMMWRWPIRTCSRRNYAVKPGDEMAGNSRTWRPFKASRPCILAPDPVSLLLFLSSP